MSTKFNRKFSSSQPISDWKGGTITAFQEDLFEKTKGRVSEKWFYTYCKNTPEKLPRIDILNLLSTYVGYLSWNDFKSKNTTSFKKKNHLKTINISYPFWKTSKLSTLELFF